MQPFDLSSALAVTYDDDSAEDHQGGKDFLPGQDIHADADAYNDRYDRLDIGVHAHQGRSDAFLTDRNKEICDECCADYQVEQFCKLYLWNRVPVESQHLFTCKRE